MANETTVKESETTVTDVDTTDRDGDGSRGNDAFTGWFASSTLRFGVVLVGIFLLLAPLGQRSGVDILGETAEILGTEVGRWLLVGVVALGLIAVAVHGFRGGADWATPGVPSPAVTDVQYRSRLPGAPDLPEIDLLPRLKTRESRHGISGRTRP